MNRAFGLLQRGSTRCAPLFGLVLPEGLSCIAPPALTAGKQASIRTLLSLDVLRLNCPKHLSLLSLRGCV